MSLGLFRNGFRNLVAGNGAAVVLFGLLGAGRAADVADGGRGVRDLHLNRSLSAEVLSRAISSAVRVVPREYQA